MKRQRGNMYFCIVGWSIAGFVLVGGLAAVLQTVLAIF